MTWPNAVRESAYPQDEEVSLIALAAIILRNRWRIVRWAFAVAVLAALSVISKPALYAASASFIPQQGEPSRSGLANLAGQLGVAIPTGNQSQSPEFYARLLKSRVILERLVRDTLVVAEMGGRRIPLLDVFEIEGETPRHREEKGVNLLKRIVSPTISKTTGAVDVSAATKWPSVSLAIVTSLVNGVNEFNQRTRQGQAAEERKFVEGRLAVVRTDLRDAEDRLERFMRANRQYESSPQLTFDHDRLQREVLLKQEVFTTLSQSYEDVRIREVRDTPVITVLEPPSVPTHPEPRGRVTSVILGFLLGGFIGVGLSFASEMFARRRRAGSVEADEFVDTLQQIKGETLGRFKRLGGRAAQ
jgi:tyrosine-protein kinase Etk/Wzc